MTKRLTGYDESRSERCVQEDTTMTKQEAFDIGKARGIEAARYNTSAEEAFEGELHSRQYDDFCNQIVPAIGDDDELWECYDEGVAEGITQKFPHGDEQ